MVSPGLSKILNALLACNRFLHTFASASVRAGTLTSDRQAEPMSDSTKALDFLKTGNVLPDQTAERAFDRVVALEQSRKPADLFLGDVSGLTVRIDLRFLAQFSGDKTAHAVEILKRNHNPLVIRDVNTKEAWHSSSPKLQNLPKDESNYPRRRDYP